MGIHVVAVADFKVVMNDDGHFLVWSVEKTNPFGWRDFGFMGTRDQCLEHIRGRGIRLLDPSASRKHAPVLSRREPLLAMLGESSEREQSEAG
jgi:MbtH protein